MGGIQAGHAAADLSLRTWGSRGGRKGAVICSCHAGYLVLLGGTDSPPAEMPGTAARPAFPMEETRERGASGENENLSPSYFSGPSGGTKPRARHLIHGLALLRRGSLNIEWLCLGNVAFEIPSLDQEAPSDTEIMIIAYFAFR